jgi:hypothetical protein
MYSGKGQGMKLYNGILLDLMGQAKAGATIKVVTAGSDNTVLLFDRNGAALANPVTTASDGRFEFRTGDGVYDFKSSDGNVVQSSVQIYDEGELFPFILAKLNDLSTKVSDVTLDNNGKLNFENGLKLKWGRISFTCNGTTLVSVNLTFPLAFVGQPYIVLAHVVRASSASDDFHNTHITSLSAIGATFGTSCEAGYSGNAILHWFAIGV